MTRLCSMIASLQFSNLTTQQFSMIFNFGDLTTQQFSMIFNFGDLTTSQFGNYLLKKIYNYYIIINFDNFQFGQFSNLATFNFGKGGLHLCQSVSPGCRCRPPRFALASLLCPAILYSFVILQRGHLDSVVLVLRLAKGRLLSAAP